MKIKQLVQTLKRLSADFTFNGISARPENMVECFKEKFFDKIMAEKILNKLND